MQEYRPYEERTPSEQYKNLIREILENGEWTPSRMVDNNGNEVRTCTYMGATPIRFNILENGAPIITERDISSFYKSAIGELFAFVNGARTQKELEEFGCRWWKAWVTEKKCAKRGLETGDLGPGSYGAAFADFPMPDGESFNQFKEIEKQMQENPELKTHFISPWIPEYTIRNTDHQQKVVVCPCHGWIHFRILGDKLSMVMFQRSCDVLVGCVSNWAQYSALLLAQAEVLGLQPYEFIHIISDAHIYENQLPWAEEILSRESQAFPTLKLVRKHKSITDYRKDDFELSDYHAGDPIKDIPVGV
ncbi:MAG: thymidylate synthase [Ruminococcus sp.]|nr:thymidylate synthase [Ruminococcus sp.]